MILISLAQDGSAVCRYPQQLAQGTNSENIVLASPFPARVPILMGWVMPDGTPLEQWVDQSDQTKGKTKYFAMTNVIDGGDLGVGNEAPLSVWTFRPDNAFTAQYGTAYACFYAQLQDQNGGLSYRKLTTNLVAIEVLETNKPDIDDDAPEGSLLEDILQAITYYNEYLRDISVNGVSTVFNTLDEAERKVYTDSVATLGSLNLITSNAVAQVFNAAKEYADDKATAALNSAKSYTDEKAQNMPVSTAQAAAIATAEQRAKQYADGKDTTVLNSAKNYTDEKISGISSSIVTGVKGSEETEYRHGDINITAANIGLGNVNNTPDNQKPVSAEQQQAIDAAEQRAKEYAASLVVSEGYGTPVYEDGTLSTALNIPKIYNDISEVDNTFDKNTTFDKLVQKMSPNSKLVSKCFYGEKNGIVVDTYAKLFPVGMDASNDLISIEKKTAEGKEVVSAELSHNKVAVWGGAEISSPSIAVEGSYTYRCPPTTTDNTVYKISENGAVETLSIDSNGDGTGVPVKWKYAIRWINDFDGTDKGVLLVGGDNNDGLYFCRLLNGVLQWVVPANGRTLPQTLIHAVEHRSVVCVYTPENTFVLLDENGILNDYGVETFTNVVSVCGVSNATLAPNAFNFIVSDSQNNLFLYTGNNSVENTATVSLYSSDNITLTDIRLWRYNVLSGKTNGKEKIFRTISLYISGWVLQIIDLSDAVDIPVGSEIVSLYGMHYGDAKMGGVAVAIKDQTTQKVSVLIDGKEAIAGGRISQGVFQTYSLPPSAHMLFIRNANVDRVYWGLNCYFSIIPEVERYVSTTNSGWKQVDIEKEYIDDVGTKVYENGLFSARLDLPKIYASIDEIDSSFDASTTPAQLASAMQSNAELTAVIDSTDYTALIPYGETGKGLLKAYKKTTGANSITFFGYQGDNKWVGVYDGSFLWKQLANEADITTAISTIMGEISGIETEISSFIRAQDNEASEGLTFSFDNSNGVAVCTGGAVSGAVWIPAYVKNNGKWYKVIFVGQNAFKDNANIVSVHFPHTIELIGSNAFENCTGLLIDKINASGDLSIENNAFKGCAITSLSIIAKSVRLGASAFQNCTAMTSFSVDYLEAAGANVFSGCTNLATIDITNDRTLTINDAPSGATVNYYRRIKNPTKKYQHNIKVTGFSVANTTLRFSLITTSNTQLTSHDALLAALTSEDDIFGVFGQMGGEFVGAFSSVEWVQSPPYNYLGAISHYYNNSALQLNSYALNGAGMTFSDNVVEL